MVPKFHRLRISDLRQETEDTVSIAFDIPQTLKEDYQFSAGQYLTLRADQLGDLRRSYSLCSAPYEQEWRVAIKQVQDGQFSTFANQKLQPGDELDVMTPAGNFTFNGHSERQGSYLLIGAGSGITPLLSIAKTMLSSEPLSDVTLIYGNKNFNSIIFREELESLKNQYMSRFRLLHVLSRENLGNSLQNGRINGEKISALFNVFLAGNIPDEVFICGPEEMILSVKDSLVGLQVDKSAIHFELFSTGITPRKATAARPNEPSILSNVSIILDGDRLDLQMDSTAESILDVAQKAGADLPFACKGGVCCTCKAKILEGSARMDVNYALEADEVAAGYVLTCQAHPTSEKLIISFDD
jgi:ring-1,2-phenylacetyl-CoA epoxidase subunit PaaE